jgi:DNA-binding FadR family transcriptional regulator
MNDIGPVLARPGQRRRGQIQSPKLAHVLADKLRRMIVSGELKPGANLPPEASLLAEYGISRPALREALRVLESEDLIAVSRGIRGGAVVLEPSIDKVAQFGRAYLTAIGATLRELHEARSIIEPPIARALATQRSTAALAVLRQAVDGAAAALLACDLKAALAHANLFHESLVQQSDNRVLGLMVGMLHDMAVRSQTAMVGLELDDQTKLRVVGRTVDACRHLVDLIEAGAADAAEIYWANYMRKTSRLLMGSGQADSVIAL